MLRVSIPQKSPSYSWLLLSLISLSAHLVLFATAQRLAASRTYEPLRPGLLDISLKRPEPEPPVPVEEEPAPEPEPEKKPVVRKPRPNLAQQKPVPEPEPEPQPVFGVTSDSVVTGGDGPSVRVGNTLEKTMEEEYPSPQRIAPLPPVDEKLPVVPRLQPVPAYRLTTAPSFKKKVEPVYPDEARRAGIEGTVQLEIWLDARGRVRKIRVLRSPGHGLDQAAVKAAARALFRPGRINGKPVPVKITIPYHFVLDD